MRDPVLRRIFILAGMVLFFWVIYLLSPVVIPFVIAFFIAYLFSPIVAKLQKIGLPRWLSISFVFVAIIVVMILIGWYIVPMAWAQLLYARDHIPEMIHWINETFLPWASSTFNLEPMEVNTDEISKSIMDYIQTNYSVNNIQDIVLRLAQSGLNFIQIGGTLVLVPIITFYFLLDWEKMLHHMQRMIPRPMESNVIQIAKECHEVLGAFVKGQFLVMILLGLVYAVGLQLIGLHVGLIIGIVAGLASIIPYLGFAIGIIAAVVATFLQFGVDWVQLALVGMVFMIGQAIEGYVLQPFLLGDKIGLSPVAVVFAVLAGAQLFGFVGMLIALPVAAIIVVLLRHLRDSYEKSTWYGAKSVATTDGTVNIDVHVSDEKQVNIECSTDEQHKTESAQIVKKDE
ncbi:AI-2E family transporter [Acinetobacter qingfengensis]|uniref:AI-2E family transporter n=1 Tax=Acinetobacter qingfengensis TaxID=1262585 RepID=A0A1E7RFM8_9GAMM|nr:AI-2E family transporter [Acinetobacter qingfengensis]KAA8732718.1 AI-2E family transporter [Acinetobacter qingfengensis]OEY98168.1 AI-2E family transporter [Acinetobacter qingfengensis]